MLASLLLMTCSVVLHGCATPLRQATIEGRYGGPSTGRVLSWAEVLEAVPGVRLGDLSYAEVDSSWLHGWYDTFRSELARQGIVRWEQRFDCNHFADFYSALAQASFHRHTFHDFTPAVALALGPFWYRRDDGRGGHAVVQVLTDRGRIFIDPQSGDEVPLSENEVASAFLQYF
jgi:hypothetical protein